jgi:uracil-DNA glycosylase family 4
MSQSARSAIFLEEMGVGAQWKLRNQPAAFAPDEEVDAILAPAPAPAPVVAEAAPAVVPAPPPTPQREPQPVAEVHTPAAPVIDAADEESTSWFDDAPAPPLAEPFTDEAIAVMDWPTLKSAIASCSRCNGCDPRRKVIPGRGPEQAEWVAIAAAPSRLDEKESRLIAGEAGQLLDNMLKAISLKPESDVYVTALVKFRPADEEGNDRNPTIDELSACRPFFDRELALTGARMAMTFGQFAAKGLMMGPAARGKVMRYGVAELPVVATYHPDDLLRKPEDKAKAWGDLCLAKAARD